MSTPRVLAPSGQRSTGFEKDRKSGKGNIYLSRGNKIEIEEKEEYNLSKSTKGTQTEKKLLTAFAGESQARNRYTFFANQARTEGYEQIANVFTETAGNEKGHTSVPDL